jgi:hypothetical protein
VIDSPTVGTFISICDIVSFSLSVYSLSIIRKTVISLLLVHYLLSGNEFVKRTSNSNG